MVKRLLATVLIACLILSPILVLRGAAWTQSTLAIMPIYAAKHYKIGYLTVDNIDGNQIRVTYSTKISRALIREAHLYVDSKAPTNSAPGRFPYKRTFTPGVTVTWFDVPIPSNAGALYIAAHSVVKLPSEMPDWDSVYARIYPSPTNTIVTSTPYGNAYAGVIPEGYEPHTAWCVNRSVTVCRNKPTPANYKPVLLPDMTVNQDIYTVIGPHSLTYSPNAANMLNYFINAVYVKEGLYHYPVLQIALWKITNNTSPYLYPTDAPPTQILEVVDDITLNGQNYEPWIGDLLAVVVDPFVHTSTGTTKHYQPMMIGIPIQGIALPATEETAWALGTERFRTGWGSYMKITLIQE